MPTLSADDNAKLMQAVFVTLRQRIGMNIVSEPSLARPGNMKVTITCFGHTHVEDITAFRLANASHPMEAMRVELTRMIEESIVIGAGDMVLRSVIDDAELEAMNALSLELARVLPVEAPMLARHPGLTAMVKVITALIEARMESESSPAVPAETQATDAPAAPVIPIRGDT